MNKKWSNLNQNQKDEVREKVGNALKKAVLQYTKSTNSPVSGEGSFARLSDKYAKYKRKRGKGSSPNLRLELDMLPSLESRDTRDGLEFGIFDSNEAQKADNHNKFSAASKRTAVPKRQFIPNKDQTFKRPILSEIKKIIEKVHGSD